MVRRAATLFRVLAAAARQQVAEDMRDLLIEVVSPVWGPTPNATPQTAVESDANALEPVLADLQKRDMLPEEMLADTSYGSDDNVQKAAVLGATPKLANPRPEPRRSHAHHAVNLPQCRPDRGLYNEPMNGQRASAHPPLASQAFPVGR